MAKTSIPREEKGGGKEEGEETHGRGSTWSVHQPGEERERERECVGEGIFMPTNSRTKRLNYP